MNAQEVTVIGDGWAALAMVGFYLVSEVKVHWIVGTQVHKVSPLACVSASSGIAYMTDLFSRFGIGCGDPRFGTFIREYRNKAFKEPLWMRAPSLEARSESMKELLWHFERRFIGISQVRFELDFFEIEEQLREAINQHPQLDLIQDSLIKHERHSKHELFLGSGRSLSSDQVIYADFWSQLGKVQGAPRPLEIIGLLEPMGVFQVSFFHHQPIGACIAESFFSSLPKESGETRDRHFYGYFSSDGMRSHWSFGLTEEEFENNHEIGKKFRKLKTSLGRMLSVTGLISGDADFSSCVAQEQVRLAQDWIFPEEKLSLLIQDPTLLWITDACGISSAFEQVGKILVSEGRMELKEVLLTEGAQDIV